MEGEFGWGLVAYHIVLIVCQGMEELIRQAFLHVEVIGPHVAEGHYDLVGPNGDIILPQVWETVIEPDWTITMHMWPMPEPEKPKEPDLPPLDDGEILIIDDVLKPKSGGGKGKAGAKKIPVPPPIPRFRGSLPPLAPDAPLINGGSKKAGAAKAKAKPGGFSKWLNGGRPAARPVVKAATKPVPKK